MTPLFRGDMSPLFTPAGVMKEPPCTPLWPRVGRADASECLAVRVMIGAAAPTDSLSEFANSAVYTRCSPDGCDSVT